MATVGENIRRYREARGMSATGLAEKAGMTGDEILHCEDGELLPSEDQVAAIAQALDVSPRMLADHGINGANDLVAALLQLEDEFGLVPDMCDGGLWIDHTAKNAQEVDSAIGAWGVMRHRLITGEITQEEYDAWRRKF
ncbi:helix-turn-helix domain-containing protein [Collinsella provencensis]|uniref:helix-turn-helix domain-containing protein n=1 Tax=Collinsella provencensis TaxID=1937461 RepID=UPI000C8381BE|nr:helix-turn-helix transcriptional regulator [Collinsella provencensis]